MATVYSDDAEAYYSFDVGHWETSLPIHRAFFVLGVILPIYTLATTALLFWNRHLPDIQRRNVWLLIPNAVAAAVLIECFCHATSWVLEYPCSLALWVNNTLWPLWCSTFMARGVKLVALHLATAEKMEAQGEFLELIKARKSRNPSTIKRPPPDTTANLAVPEFLKQSNAAVPVKVIRYLEKNVRFYVIGVQVVTIIYTLLIQLVLRPFGFYDLGIACTKPGIDYFPTFLIVAFYLFVGCPFLFYFLRRLRNDSFGIKRDLSISLFIGIPGFVLYFIWSFVSTPGFFYVQARYFPSTFWPICLLFLSHQVSIVLPIYEAYRVDILRRRMGEIDFKTKSQILVAAPDRHDHKHDQPYQTQMLIGNELEYTYECFLIVMANPNSNPNFKELKKECTEDFSIENILFYEAYAELHHRLLKGGNTTMSTSTSGGASMISDNIGSFSSYSSSGGIPSSFFASFLAIYETFIQPGSPLELNITEEAREGLKSAYSRVIALKNKDANADAPSTEPALTYDVLDKTKKEILYLIYRNTFVRFVRNRKSADVGDGKRRRSDMEAA